MQLKEYQADTLGILRRFLEESRIAGPAAAYEKIVAEPEQAARLRGAGGNYAPLEGLPGTPYVCLRLPTGGGKTILGAYAIGVARDAWIEKDFPLVLWLVPTNTIRLQTVEALKNTRHAYRQALDEVFGGRVRVFDIADFPNIRPHDIRDNACVVVATIQTLRVKNTDGRKVYAHHEDMEAHFSALPKNIPGLEQIGEGKGPRFSFANLLHLHRPLMIVDEAHNAVTGLSRELQQRVNPCAIVEFTATPKDKSNILHSVSAQELKQAEMIKLPIVLAEHQTWQGAVNAAIATRATLAQAAQTERGYIRPIVLFQAQPRNGEVTVEALKTHLMDSENIPEHCIAVATGDQRELDGIDLFDPKCPIEYVITVEALKEGWDCSFAYVFCSLQKIGSATDAEQLLGRVLRMPYAARRKSAALNRAYAHVSEPSFGVAAKALRDRLIDMGFGEEEATDAIKPAQGHFDETGLFAFRERDLPEFTFDLTPEAADALKAGGIAIRAVDGAMQIAVSGPISPQAERAIAEKLPEEARGRFAKAAAKYRADNRQHLTPAERGEEFTVPRLMAEFQGELDFAENFFEYFEWNLSDHPVRLSASEFSIHETARNFEIDIDGHKVDVRWGSEVEQLLLDVQVDGWTSQALVLWLDRELRQSDIGQSDMVRWLSDAVGHLHATRGMSIAELMRGKFLLARKLAERIISIRKKLQSGAFQKSMFAPDARVEVSFEHGFGFHDGMYTDVRRHRNSGGFKFSKHFLGPDNVPAFESDQGEEFQCAKMLDTLPKVAFWLRNVAKNSASFWLPLADGRFFPDFVAKLNDGRMFVVEYKGALLAGPGNDETNEKRAVGALWERAGGGLFLMVEKTVEGRDMRAQMLGKLGS